LRSIFGSHSVQWSIKLQFRLIDFWWENERQEAGLLLVRGSARFLLSLIVVWARKLRTSGNTIIRGRSDAVPAWQQRIKSQSITLETRPNLFIWTKAARRGEKRRRKKLRNLKQLTCFCHIDLRRSWRPTVGTPQLRYGCLRALRSPTVPDPSLAQTSRDKSRQAQTSPDKPIAVSSKAKPSETKPSQARRPPFLSSQFSKSGTNIWHVASKLWNQFPCYQLLFMWISMVPSQRRKSAVCPRNF